MSRILLNDKGLNEQFIIKTKNTVRSVTMAVVFRMIVLLISLSIAISQFGVGAVNGGDERGCQEPSSIIIPLHKWLLIDAAVLLFSVALYTYNFFKPRNTAMEYAVAMIAIVTLITGASSFRPVKT